MPEGPEELETQVGLAAAATGTVRGRWTRARRRAISLLLLPRHWLPQLWLPLLWLPLLWLPLLWLPLLCGCSLLPNRDAPGLTEPAASTPSAPPATERDKPAAPAPAKAPPSATARAIPQVEVAPAAAAAPADSTQQIMVQLSTEEREKLIAQADEDSRFARERLDQVDVARMTPDSSERLEAVRDLLASIDDARARGDVRTAALLARKVRILAQDLPKK